MNFLGFKKQKKTDVNTPVTLRPAFDAAEKQHAVQKIGDDIRAVFAKIITQVPNSDMELQAMAQSFDDAATRLEQTPELMTDYMDPAYHDMRIGSGFSQDLFEIINHGPASLHLRAIEALKVISPKQADRVRTCYDINFLTGQARRNPNSALRGAALTAVGAILRDPAYRPLASNTRDCYSGGFPIKELFFHEEIRPGAKIKPLEYLAGLLVDRMNWDESAAVRRCAFEQLRDIAATPGYQHQDLVRMYLTEQTMSQGDTVIDEAIKTAFVELETRDRLMQKAPAPI